MINNMENFICMVIVVILIITISRGIAQQGLIEDNAIKVYYSNSDNSSDHDCQDLKKRDKLNRIKKGLK